MKTTLIIILMSLFSVIGSYSNQVSAPGFQIRSTAVNLKKYTLFSDQNSLSKPQIKNTGSRNKPIISKIVSINLKLSNNSDDTLKYVTMSCCWTEVFTVNNSKIQIVNPTCDNNFPVVKTINPHRSVNFTMHLSYDEKTPENTKFQIGAGIIRYISVEELNESLNNLPIKNSCKHVVWSNVISTW